MRLQIILALVAHLCACGSMGSSRGLDPVAVADTIALYRQDVLDVAYLADPATQAEIVRLSAAIERVESALRMSDHGSASSAASMALSIAEGIAAHLAPESEVRFYIALAKIALRHVQVGSMSEVVAPQDLVSGANMPAQ